ncbi:MAG: hypothetical protein WDN24_12770 [Sphingomonas sp.]
MQAASAVAEDINASFLNFIRLLPLAGCLANPGLPVPSPRTGARSGGRGPIGSLELIVTLFRSLRMTLGAVDMQPAKTALILPDWNGNITGSIKYETV